ncbi:MAG: YcgN family cysteine cluster protein [Pseudomonadales bacterium]|nr:YcgN family cysteine cluster protein [Pseudomonadales bacterium]
MTAEQDKPFWETKTLADMTPAEWEALCDGCAKCCLHKLEDEDSGMIHYTRVACRYLDQKKCRCTVYETRKRLVPDCIKLEPGEISELHWMPGTCAYRLLDEGRPLPVWHPLLTGDRKALVETGNSVSGKVISEDHVHEEGFDEHIIHWV